MGSARSFNFVMTVSVNLSQPLLRCEFGLWAATVRTVFRSKTPCLAQDTRQPLPGREILRSACSSLKMLTSDGGGLTPPGTEKARPCAWPRSCRDLDPR